MSCISSRDSPRFTQAPVQILRRELAARGGPEAGSGSAGEFRETCPETTALLVQGPTVETVLGETGKLGADLVVVGSHGHGAAYDLLVGSVSAGVIRKSPVPVLVVPVRGE